MIGIRESRWGVVLFAVFVIRVHAPLTKPYCGGALGLVALIWVCLFEKDPPPQQKNVVFLLASLQKPAKKDLFY